MKTPTGACLSINIVLLTFLFAMIKLQQLIERRRPTVTEFVNEQAFELSDQYSMNEDSFMLAVAAESYG